VDGETAYNVEKVLGVEKFLTGLGEELRFGSFRPDVAPAGDGHWSLS
jgi:hypothetical protein